MERAQVAHADEVSDLEQARYPPYISPTVSPPQYLPHISTISPLYLPQARSRLEGEIAAEVAAREEGTSRLATVEAEAAALREEVESLRKVESM